MDQGSPQTGGARQVLHLTPLKHTTEYNTILYKYCVILLACMHERWKDFS